MLAIMMEVGNMSLTGVTNRGDGRGKRRGKREVREKRRRERREGK